MTPEIEAVIRMAEESEDAAELLLNAGSFRFSASRSCYTMLYIWVGDEEFVKEPSIIEEKAYRDTLGRGVCAHLNKHLYHGVDIRLALGDNERYATGIVHRPESQEDQRGGRCRFE